METEAFVENYNVKVTKSVCRSPLSSCEIVNDNFFLIYRHTQVVGSNIFLITLSSDTLYVCSVDIWYVEESLRFFLYTLWECWC